MNQTELIAERLQDAKAIAWDECHKIYVLMDDEQTALMREYHYPTIITSGEATPEEMMEYLQDWYAKACGLKFVEAVTTNEDDPNAGFERLVPQGEEWEM